MKITPFLKLLNQSFQSTGNAGKPAGQHSLCRGAAKLCLGRAAAGLLTRAASLSAQPAVSLMSAQPAVTTSVLLPQQGASGSFFKGMQSPHLQGIRIQPHESGAVLSGSGLLP